MIDLDTAVDAQNDLEALCREPVDPGPSEREKHNSGYGFAQILKRYADYPLDKPVEAVIPHGVYLDTQCMLPYELDAPVPAVLNYPAFRSQIWETSSAKEVIPSASPFLYAREMFNEVYPVRPSRSGTLFFTPHRGKALNTVSDYTPLFRALHSLEERYQPVTLCASICDFRRGDHVLFREAGFDVVCAGQPEDQDFTYRWLHLLSRHRYSASTCVGGYLFHAVAAGAPFFTIDALERRLYSPTAYLGTRPSAQTQETTNRIADLFAEASEGVAPEAREIIDYMLGAENLKQPEQLRSDLEYAEHLARDSHAVRNATTVPRNRLS